MTPLLFALALLAAPSTPDQLTTAGQLYDGCVSYVAQKSTSSASDDIADVMCAAEVAVTQAVEAADAAMDSAGGGQRAARAYCLPESALSGEGGNGAPLAQAFIAYVDRNPASRDMDFHEVFQRALAEKWPCPH